MYWQENLPTNLRASASLSDHLQSARVPHTPRQKLTRLDGAQRSQRTPGRCCDRWRKSDRSTDNHFGRTSVNSRLSQTKLRPNQRA
ncbi:hypothetical protein RRG08_027862 [Elysia crispata]|uniref:Uncharacterized protein n=1 Tax=Elysia crispata TaxID=231223 RepID=A0AAE1D4B2_9GAST|nr:hypothetical protein RRG08_027862 [Elysia crispata]